jgi:hypothetical protein
MAGPREAGGEGSAEGFAESEREETEAGEEDSHRNSSIIVPREAEGLRVKDAGGAEGACDTLFESIGIESGVEETVNTTSAKRGNYKRAVAESFAAANNPIGVKLEFDTAWKPHPHTTDRLSGGGSDRDGITALKTSVEFRGKQFTHGEKARLDGGEVVSGSVDDDVKDWAGIGLRDIAGEISFVYMPDIPID